jgi:predicted NBD/HSP70 family sugar kinase
MEKLTSGTVIHRLRAELLARDDGNIGTNQGADYRTLREYNHLLVLNSVRLQGPIARVAIAQQTGLSKTTVSSIIDQLLQDGLVAEGDFVDAAATGGRRPILVQFAAQLGYILGAEVSYTSVTIVATNLAGEVKGVHTEPFDLTASPANCVARLAAAIRIFMAKDAMEWEDVLGIGVGIAAPLDLKTHALLYPPGEHSWEGVDVTAVLTQEFGVPAFVDNNANLAALSEARYGVAQTLADFVYIFVGQGIGSGLMLNRQVYRGAQGAAGEIGHLHLADDGPLCVCGKRGCLETVADNDAIIDDATQGLTLQQMNKRARPGLLANQDDVDINDVLHAAEAGDIAAILALQRAGRYLGMAVATLVTVLNPSAVIIDGNVVRSGRYVIDALREETVRRVLPTVWPATQIMVGQLGDLAVALGAASMVIDAAFAPTTQIAVTEYSPPT